MPAAGDFPALREQKLTASAQHTQKTPCHSTGQRCNAAFAAPFRVCPAIGKVRQIDICVGNPKDLVYLAPDDDSDKYSLGYFNDHGEFITIRCEYTDGKARDVELWEHAKSAAVPTASATGAIDRPMKVPAASARRRESRPLPAN